jgi:hypothetical protein
MIKGEQFPAISTCATKILKTILAKCTLNLVLSFISFLPILVITVITTISWNLVNYCPSNVLSFTLCKFTVYLLFIQLHIEAMERIPRLWGREQLRLTFLLHFPPAPPGLCQQAHSACH